VTLMIDSKVCLVFIYGKTHRYGTNVLIGYLETLPQIIKYVDIYVVKPDEIHLLSTLARKYRLRVVAYSLLTTYVAENLNEVLKVVETSRRLGYLSIAGGPHPSGDPLGTLKSLKFDYCIIGEGEEPLVEFISNLISGNDILSTKGLAYLDNDKLVVNTKFKVKDLDNYPPFAERSGLFNPIEISRGCIYACKFCQVSYIFSSNVRHRSIENIVKYARKLVKRGIRDVRFISPDSFGYGSRGKWYPEKVIELINELQRVRNEGGRVFLGTFPSEVRPEHVSEELVRELVGKVDNKRVIVGAQTGSEKLLKVLNRGHTPEDVINAVEILRKYGFRVDVDYIFGLPSEDEEDVELTLNHMRKVVTLGGRVHAHVFLPLPGTPLARAPPGRIPVKVRKFMYKLLGRGFLYGQWERQERLAQMIAKLRSDGIILPRVT